MDPHYKSLIWTNHALSRLKERNIKQSDAWATWNHPDHSRPGSAPGSFVYYRTFGNQKIEIVAKKNEHAEWIILSVWSSFVSPNSPNHPKSLLLRLFNSLFK